MNAARLVRLLFPLLTCTAALADPPLSPSAFSPYADPSQLDCPWPKHSDYKQPWRGFVETKSAANFLDGIGINYNVPNNDEVAVRLLAECGFKTFRIEIGWGSVKWDEGGINNDARTRKLLALCKQHGIRPLLLLNANQGVPCPVRFFTKTLAEPAREGATTIKLTDTKDLVPGRSGLNQLTGYWAAEAIVTKIDSATGECTLSKPLKLKGKTELPAGAVQMATLKYLPLYPAGTPEFEESAGGWVKYAKLVGRLAADAGIDEFDVEIWNELSFGSKFLDVNNYYSPALTPKPKDFLNPGGNCWELARRTIEAVKRDHPKARCVWGFSNTTFYHCPIEKLPPGTDGQSYHPYGTGTRELPKDEDHKDRPQDNLEGFVPAVTIRMPEGVAHVFLKTECLMRPLSPAERLVKHPPGVTNFRYYMTEHGVAPAECGIAEGEEDREWGIKTQCALRSFCLWLNKGVGTMHYFCAWEKRPSGMGLLPPNTPQLAKDAQFDDVATPPMRAMRNLTRAFADNERIAKPVALSFEIAPPAPLPTIPHVFEGDGTAAHPPLTFQDVVALLPFQAKSDRFIVAAYVMTYDVTHSIEPRTWRVRIQGLPEGVNAAQLYDVTRDQTLPVTLRRGSAAGKSAVEVELPLTDVPRLLILTR